jgi:hypothetical protein
MNIEDQVCSFVLSNRLKELGVKQDSYFYWHYPIYGKETLEWEITDHTKISTFRKDMHFSAFTVAELGEMLPAYGNIDGNISNINFSKYIIPVGKKIGEINYSCDYWIDKGHYRGLGKGCYDTNEANARSEMLIYLLENKLMELPNG